jgi:S-adenosylmethionine synthetase
LRVKQHIKQRIASYWHFDRAEFPWEKTDKTEALKKTIGSYIASMPLFLKATPGVP